MSDLKNILDLYSTNFSNLCDDFYQIYTNNKRIKLNCIYFKFAKEFFSLNFNHNFIINFIDSTAQSWTLFKINPLEFIINYGYNIFDNLALPNDIIIFNTETWYLLSSDDRECLVSYFEAFIKLSLKYIKITGKYNLSLFKNEIEIFKI